MKNYQTVILDFDGVIVESLGIRDDAFRELFKDYPHHLSAIMNYHKSNDAIIRYEKFRVIYEEILEVPYTAEVSTRLGVEFSKLISEKIVACPYVKGVPEFLEEFSRHHLLYLVSVNPAEELKSIVRARQLDRYFSEIYPYPWSKVDAIRDILRRNAYLAKEAVFIGDSPEDFDAAQMVGVDFIGRQSGRSWGNRKPILFQDFVEITQYLSLSSHVDC